MSLEEDMNTLSRMIEFITQGKNTKANLHKPRDLEKEADVVKKLNQSGFIGLDGAIDLFNLGKIERALLVYKHYLASEPIGTSPYQQYRESYDSVVDPLFLNAVEFIITSKTAKTDAIQEHFQIDYSRAASVVQDMNACGIISEDNNNGHFYMPSPYESIKRATDYFTRSLRRQLKKEVKYRDIDRNQNILLNELEARCFELVRSFKSTLTKKHKQTVIVDDYGKKITELWNKEKEYFLNNIVFGDDDISDLQNRILNKNYLLSRCQDIVYQEIDDVISSQSTSADSTDLVDINGLTPAEFEQFCCDEFIKNGWIARVNGKTGDQGVDVIAEKNHKIVAAQCKLYSLPIGNSAVQEVFSGKRHHEANIAVVISNQPFTRSAKQLAATTGVILLHYSEIDSMNQLAMNINQQTHFHIRWLDDRTSPLSLDDKPESHTQIPLHYDPVLPALTREHMNHDLLQLPLEPQPYYH